MLDIDNFMLKVNKTSFNYICVYCYYLMTLIKDLKGGYNVVSMSVKLLVKNNLLPFYIFVLYA